MLGEVILMDNSGIILYFNQKFQSISHLSGHLWARALSRLHVELNTQLHSIPMEMCMLGDIMDMDNSGIIL